MKKTAKTKKKSQILVPSSTPFRLAIAFFVVAIILFIAAKALGNDSAGKNPVLGAHTYLVDSENSNGGDSSASSEDETSSDQEKEDKVEPTDAPEPTDVPEKQQAVEKVQKEINNQVENNHVNQVELQPSQEGSDSGKVILQKPQGAVQELTTPVSNTTPVTQISTPQAGTVTVHIGSQNAIIINNGPYAITTQYPVVINPADQTMAIRTPSGVTVIKTFPTQIFQNPAFQSQLSSVSSLNLVDQQGTPIYQADGTEVKKFLGILPVKANVSENINAQTGQVVKTNVPWYYSIFGFAFSST